MATPDAAQDGPLSPEVVAEWLDLRQDESIVSEPAGPPPIPRRRGARVSAISALVAGLLSVLLIPALAGAWGHGGPALAVLLLLGCASLMAGTIMLGTSEHQRQLAPWLTKGDPTIEADGTGLTVTYPTSDRAEWFAWTAITGVEPLYGPAQAGGYREVERWLVRTESGRTFHLRADVANADKILEVARRVVLARSQGRPLWDASTVPEGGLSRLTGVEEPPSEAGLSRVDD